MLNWLRSKAFKVADRHGDAAATVDLNTEFPSVMEFMELQNEAVRAFRCPSPLMELVRTTFRLPSDVLVACFIWRINKDDVFLTPTLDQKFLPAGEKCVVLLSDLPAEEFESNLVHELTHYKQFKTGRAQDEGEAQENEL